MRHEIAREVASQPKVQMGMQNRCGQVPRLALNLKGCCHHPALQQPQELPLMRVGEKTLQHWRWWGVAQTETLHPPLLQNLPPHSARTAPVAKTGSWEQEE